MKLLLPLFYLFISFSFFSQSERLIPYSYNIIPKIENNELYSLKWYSFGHKNAWKKGACDGEKCKLNVQYNKIKLLPDNSPEIYAKGMLGTRDFDSKKPTVFNGPVSLFYEKNNKPILSGTYSNTGYLKKDAPLTYYYKTGELKISSTPYINKNNNKQTRVNYYDTTGAIIFSADGGDLWYGNSQFLPSYFDMNDNSKRYVNFIDINSDSTNYINNQDGSKYEGYKFIGTYTTPQELSLSGFILTTIESLGNGTILYVKNPNESIGYYAVYFDGIIDERFKIPATDVNANQFINELQFNTNIEVSSTKNKNDFYQQPLYTIKTKNLDTHTGFGIDYYSMEIDATTFVRSLRIGFFKNGKLDGLGYKVNFTQNINGNYAHQQVDYKYGFFKDGVLIEGEKHIASGHLEENNWYPIKDNRFLFAKREHPTNLIQTDKKIAIKYLNPKDKDIYVYIPQVRRFLKLSSVDYKNKTYQIVGFKSYLYPARTEIDTVNISFNEKAYFMELANGETAESHCYSCQGDGYQYITRVEAVRKPGLRTNELINSSSGYYDATTNEYYHFNHEKVTRKEKCLSCGGRGKVTHRNNARVYNLVLITE